MTEIQGKSILVRVSVRFELARVRVIGSRLCIPNCDYILIVLEKMLKEMTLHWERGWGNEQGQRENEKWEQKRIGNEVIVRARVHFHFLGHQACCPLPANIPGVHGYRF